MIENVEMSQETTAVHDVLSLFRDKIVHDVMNPDTYLHRHGIIPVWDCADAE